MKQFHFNTNKKLVKLNYLLENSKIKSVSPCFQLENSVETVEMSKNVSLFFSLIEKPINLLFSIDQFIFEFSKKTHQQRKAGDFFHQLKERKKLSLFYGHLTRKQIFNIFTKAKKNKGSFSKNILCLLEKRLDVVLYRSGLAKTIAESRQLVKHKKILVNEKIVNVPSFSLNPGDLIEMTSKTGESLSNLIEFKAKTMKISPKSVRSAYSSRFKKTADSSLNYQHSKNFLNYNAKNPFHSQILCKLLIQLLCTKIKSRSFCSLLATLPPSTLPNTKQVHQNQPEHTLLTVLKWKCFSQKRLASFRKSEKHVAPKVGLKPQNGNQRSLYANQGFLQKKPLFWNQNVSGLEKHKIVKQRHSQTHKNSLRVINFKKNYGLVYRKNFLLFLNSLENSQKFQRVLGLNINKFLLKTSFSKQRYKVSPFSKNGAFRFLRPMNFEISYNLLSVIYLYSPQRVNFPFYIDLDLIQRSLR